MFHHMSQAEFVTLVSLKKSRRGIKQVAML